MSTRQENWPALRLAVLDEMVAFGFNTPEDLHRASGVSGNTIRAFIDGENQPHLSTLRRMTVPFGWGQTWPQAILRGEASLRQLRLNNGDDVEVPIRPRDPATHSLQEATDAELDAEIERRRESGHDGA